MYIYIYVEFTRKLCEVESVFFTICIEGEKQLQCFILFVPRDLLTSVLLSVIAFSFEA